MNDTDAEDNGIVLHLEDGTPVRVELMDEEERYLRPTVNPEDGVIGYENEQNSVTMFLTEP